MRNELNLEAIGLEKAEAALLFLIEMELVPIRLKFTRTPAPH
jgi:hypothetical protein